MSTTVVTHTIYDINNAWTDISIEDPDMTRNDFWKFNGPFLGPYNYSYIEETRDDNSMTSTFKIISNIGYPSTAIFDTSSYSNQRYTFRIGTVSASGSVPDYSERYTIDTTRVGMPDGPVYTLTHRDAVTVSYSIRYTARVRIESWFSSATNIYDVIVTQSGTITSEAFIKKLYGSVNNQSERVIKLYGSKNGQSKRIKKLYGGVNGFSKRIF